MKVWLVRGDCGDYYCGCGGGHVLAVATDGDEAVRLAKEAEDRQRFAYCGGSIGTFSETTIDGPYETGELIQIAFDGRPHSQPEPPLQEGGEG